MKPILFSTNMIQAILAGNKTQTRRILKPQPGADTDVSYMPNEPLNWKGEWFEYKWETEEGETICKHPKYNVGDVLWVRETFAEWENGGYAYKADGFIERYGAWERDTPKKFHDVERVEKWKPSIFMPKDACRIFLEVTSVRAERLQDISEDDAIAEGIKHIEGPWYQNYEAQKLSLIHISEPTRPY